MILGNGWVTKQMNKWADNKCRHVEFDVGDILLVKILLSQYKYTCSLHKGFI